MRGENDAQAVFGDGIHQRGEELAPRERVEAGNRLVEQKQLGSLGERDGERDLRSLSARQLADLALEWDPQLAEALLRPRLVEMRVQVAAERQRVGDAEAAIERRVLRDEADPQQDALGVARVAAEDGDLACARGEYADR